MVAILRNRASGQAALDRLVYNEAARLQSLQIPHAEPEVMLGRVAVMCAGTADLPVAEEAAAITELCNAKVCAGGPGFQEALGQTSGSRSYVLT